MKTMEIKPRALELGLGQWMLHWSVGDKPRKPTSGQSRTLHEGP